MFLEIFSFIPKYTFFISNRFIYKQLVLKLLSNFQGSTHIH